MKWTSRFSLQAPKRRAPSDRSTPVVAETRPIAGLPTREEFNWAFTTSLTRAFEDVEVELPGVKNRFRVLALVPWADMLNHDVSRGTVQHVKLCSRCLIVA